MQGIETRLGRLVRLGRLGQETLPVMQGIETLLDVGSCEAWVGGQETLPVMQGIETYSRVSARFDELQKVRKPSP